MKSFKSLESTAYVLAKTKIPVPGKKRFATVTTFEARMPRMILPQFNTHRALSKSASSARAIPGRRYRAALTGYIPAEFPKNGKGMKPKEVLEGFQELAVTILWKALYYITCGFHQLFIWLGLHKEIANRILDAFAWVQVIVTTTYMQNFYALRAHPDAQFQIRDLAYKTLREAKKKRATIRHIHLPLISQEDITEVLSHDDFKKIPLRTKLAISYQLYKLVLGSGSIRISDYTKIDQKFWMLLIAINTAKTARGSYLNHFQPKNLADNLDTYSTLVVDKPIHASPAESCAMSLMFYNHLMANKSLAANWRLHTRYANQLNGNFTPGVVQFRKIIEDSYEE